MRRLDRRVVWALGILGGVALAYILVVGVIGLIALFSIDEPDPDRARREAQAYYDRYFPGRVNVLGCAHVQGDSDESWDCEIARTCRGRVALSIPRANGLFRFDADARPSERLPLRC